jgi:hypothetical protein
MVIGPQNLTNATASRSYRKGIVAGVSGGANPLWLTEWLTEKMEFHPGMRVLDLGCGRAFVNLSSSRIRSAGLGYRLMV